jgi:hypothetical protein
VNPLKQATTTENQLTTAKAIWHQLRQNILVRSLTSWEFCNLDSLAKTKNETVWSPSGAYPVDCAGGSEQSAMLRLLSGTAVYTDARPARICQSFRRLVFVPVRMGAHKPTSTASLIAPQVNA